MSEQRSLGESDWEDIDLLTTEEATVRLDADIEALKARLADAPDDVAARARIEVLTEARARLSAPRKFNLPKV
jgi:hypothetical protein